MSSPPKASTSPAAQAPAPTEPVIGAIQADDGSGPNTDSDDYDSVYESDSASLTETLQSTVKKWQYENNRRYHAYKPGHWVVPNDEQQQEQMDIFHEVYTRTTAGELHLAPIGDKPTKVLDAGTGTGIWAIQFADRYPSAQVIGNDLSPIQPNWVPPNCTFEVDDFTQDWTYSPNSFDFVHARALHGAVASWDHFCAQAFKVLKPGGWIEICGEIVEFHSDDDTLPADSHVQEWMRNIHKATELSGKTANAHKVAKAALEKAGFDIGTYKQEVFKMPVGTWPKDKALKQTGAMNLVNCLMGIEGFVLALYTRFLGMSEAEARGHAQKCQAELKNKKIHSYFPFQVTYAQKPAVAT